MSDATTSLPATGAPAAPVRRVAGRYPTRAGPSRFLILSILVHGTAFGAVVVLFPPGKPPQAPSSVRAQWEAPPPELMPEDVPEPPTEIPPEERPETELEPTPLEVEWATPVDEGPPTIALSSSIGRTPGGRPKRRGVPGGTGVVTPVAIEAPPAPPQPEPPPPPAVEPVREVARAISKPAPKYPEAARASGIEGAVRLVVEVLEDGTVGEVEIEQSSGSAVLDDEAVRGVRKWKFTPARVDGVPVRSRVRTPLIRFRIDTL